MYRTVKLEDILEEGEFIVHDDCITDLEKEIERQITRLKYYGDLGGPSNYLEAVEKIKKLLDKVILSGIRM